MARSIAVTGATGRVGRRVAARLGERGLAQRLIVRDRGAAADIGGDVAITAGYSDIDSMTNAFQGAGTVFFVPAHESPRRAQEHETVVSAAQSAGVDHIVYLSFLGAAPECTFTFGRDHYATEESIRQSGLPFTFLRMSFYMEGVPRFVGADGAIRGPAGDGHLGAITRDNVADAAAAVVADPSAHTGMTYDLTGRETFSFEEAAATMSDLSGKHITYIDETEDEAWESRARYGAEDWELQGWISTYAAIAEGELDVVTDAVEQLAGVMPETLAEYVRANPECLDHVED